MIVSSPARWTGWSLARPNTSGIPIPFRLVLRLELAPLRLKAAAAAGATGTRIPAAPHPTHSSIRVFFRSRLDPSLEVLALRQQVAVLKRKQPRPSLNRVDRFFWTTLRYES